MKSPYKVLYSNDTTQILSCVSPHQPHPAHRHNAATDQWEYVSPPFTAAMLEASVDETAGQGIDVHLLQPGLGWVPWWKSKVYPFAEHIRFMKEHTGMSPDADGFAAYMADGGDMVDVFVRRCRRHGLAPFVSFRLNDSHGHEFLNVPHEEIPSWAWHVLTPTHYDHPEWRISRDLSDWSGRVMNWAIPEVPALKMAYIREIIEQYDLDGFELDFMRHCRFFNEAVTPLAERRRIMNAFVQEVRRLLDIHARPGQRRWLSVRIPADLAAHDNLGLDVRSLAEVGVDIFNLSCFYFTRQHSDFAAIARLVPDCSVYLEMCHCTTLQPLGQGFYDNFLFRRTTPRQYYTTAHLAHARGLAGVSTFNFVYYRQHGVLTDARGPFHEPPFEIHRGCADPAFLARQPQHYFLGGVWNDPTGVERPLNTPSPESNHGKMYREMTPGVPVSLPFDMAPPAGGWREGGRLRVQSTVDLGASVWQASFNGQSLKETGDRSEPYGAPYPQLLGTPAEHRAWELPAALLRDGINTVEVRLVSGDRSMPMSFVDIIVQ